MIFNTSTGDSVNYSLTASNGNLIIFIDSIQKAGDIAIKVSNATSTKVVAGITTSINSTEISNKFDFFPNPVQNTLTIQRNENLISNCTVSVINAFGIVLKTLPWNASTVTLNVDMGQYPEGLYFIRISNADASQTYKILHVK